MKMTILIVVGVAVLLILIYLCRGFFIYKIYKYRMNKAFKRGDYTKIVKFLLADNLTVKIFAAKYLVFLKKAGTVNNSKIAETIINLLKKKGKLIDQSKNNTIHFIVNNLITEDLLRQEDNFGIFIGQLGKLIEELHKIKQ